VSSFVKDLIAPILSLASRDCSLENQYFTVKCPNHLPSCEKWNTLAAAADAGAVTLNWGKFVQSFINFLIIAFVLFLIVETYSAAFCRDKEVTLKECVYCFTDIHVKATRCSACTSSI
jgi:large conductance mechanosensitive channel